MIAVGLVHVALATVGLVESYGRLASLAFGSQCTSARGIFGQDSVLPNFLACQLQ